MGGVPSELILSIIIKEQFTKSIPDWAAELDSKLRGGAHSVGLGAIFASKAREAWSDVSSGTVLPATNAELQAKLKNDDAFNIDTIGVFLVYNAKKLYGEDVDIASLSMDDWEKVVPYYNAKMNSPESRIKGMDYSSKVFAYIPYAKDLLR